MKRGWRRRQWRQSGCRVLRDFYVEDLASLDREKAVERLKLA